MIGTGMLSDNKRSPSLECYTTLLMMTIYNDTLHWSDIKPIFDPVTDLDIITEFDNLPNCGRFHRTFATAAACQQRTLTPPDTWSYPTLGLTCVLVFIPISSALVLFLNFWVSSIPRFLYFSFRIDGTLSITGIVAGGPGAPARCHRVQWAQGNHAVWNSNDEDFLLAFGNPNIRVNVRGNAPFFSRQRGTNAPLINRHGLPRSWNIHVRW